MKIYISPVSYGFQDDHQGFVWPPQNCQAGGDMGVEQDFLNWLMDRPDIIVDSPTKADWNYIPIFWNRRYINYLDEDNAWGGHTEELAEEVNRVKIEGLPSFTIAEADIKWLNPQIDFEDMVVFVASRRDENGGIDIPLLSAPHPTPEPMPRKKWLASFMGNLRTDGVRMDMAEETKRRRDCKIEHANVPPEVFTRVMLESYIALCPRGQGAQSFRMYEAMQLGVAPLYISDMDCRPFRNWIDWDIFSFWLNDVYYLNELLNMASSDKERLSKMGEHAQWTYSDYLYYGKWCKFVLKELELL